MTGSDRQRSDAPCYGAVASWAPVDAALDRHGRFEVALEVQVRVGSLDPEMVWEMTFGIYLIAKGFTSQAMRRPTGARHTEPSVAAIG